MSNLDQLINKEDDYSYVYQPPASTNGIDDKGDTSAVTSSNNNNNNSNEVSQETILTSFEKIKTHFPAARIKKIMQSDDEIGKVAQATPVIVGRALEIFMANLVEVSMVEAKRQGVKRITASHIRSAIENTEQFDFLVEAVEKYPPLKN
ncbi:histone-fold-containing protein [Scheffersomyces amazonensis]|uniref:histone-fold-containing protein n=1 Tax=Scheffersomyces amazonensis TaxID=1078765 RepID=UPI00315CEB17